MCRNERVGADDAIVADDRTVQYGGVDADYAAVADDRAVDHCTVTDGDILTDDARLLLSAMQDRAILDIRIPADSDYSGIAAQDCRRPYADAVRKFDSAEDD
jgi:hypothetical protein